MALSETSNANPPEKTPVESNKHEKRDKPSTKVVVRRLPPSMTKDAFLTQVSPIPDYDYMYTVKGDLSLGENAFSRVYINFANTEDIFMFKEKFDNYVFVDAKGHEYAAVVEFASFQKIPKKRGKPRPDPKVGSIESDPLYIEFLESLKEQPNKDEKPEFSYQPSNENKNDESTPLLDYLKQRKIDRLKSREEKREERRKRDIERKKQRDEERKKRYDEKSPAKTVIKSSASQSKSDVSVTEKGSDKTEMKSKPETEKGEEKSDKIEEKVEKSSDKQSSTTYKSKERKYDDFKTGSVKPKPKYPPRSDKYESYERKDFKSRRDEYRERERRGKYDDHKKEDYKKDDGKKDDCKKEQELKQCPKKVKKYSERREERKIEAKRAEQKKEEMSKIDETKSTEKDSELDKIKSTKSDSSSFERSNSEENKPNVSANDEWRKISSKETDKDDYKSDDQDRDKSKNKENDPRMQRRIRNKDRPTMQLYQPGMLSKRRQDVDDKDPKETSSVKE